MPKLYTYCLRNDDGAAPNPFGGLCTLVICKPAIRRVAKVGDWILGTGSKNSPVGDTSGRLVYAMRVTKVLTMAEYDRFVREQCPEKLPSRTNPVGDAIYDFSKKPPRVRPWAVHGEHDRDHDLGGEHALLSTDFCYFGKNALELPAELLPIVHQTQNHRSRANDSYFAGVVRWLSTLPRGVHGDPQGWEDAGSCGGPCARPQRPRPVPPPRRRGPC